MNLHLAVAAVAIVIVTAATTIVAVRNRAARLQAAGYERGRRQAEAILAELYLELMRRWRDDHFVDWRAATMSSARLVRQAGPGQVDTALVKEVADTVTSEPTARHGIR